MDRWKHRIRARLRSFLRRAAVERELDAELAFHVQQSVAENVAAGMGPNEARALASRAFGSISRTKDQCRESLGLRLIDEIRQDVLYAVRWLLKNWAFTLVAVLTLALGTGANTTIFSTIDALLIRPLPYHDPDRLVMVWEDATAAGFPRNTPAPGNYTEWTGLNRSFEALAATRSATTNLTLDGPPEQIVGRAVTANFFAVLGTPPLVGRTFSTDEDRSRAPVVIISYALWQRRYNGDPSILNRTLLMDDNRHEIIGVMPKPFVFLNRDVDYWVPMHFSPAEALDRRSHYLNVVGRLKPGVTADSANADMRRVSETLRQQFPDTNVWVTTVVVPVKDDLLGDTRLELLVLMGAALAVLLIACANLAGLLLSRAAARRSEFAVRAALGATRGRLVRQSIVEGLALSLAGSAVGLLIAKIAAGLIADLAPVGFLPVETSILNWRLLVFAIVTAGTAALAFSIVPAIQAARESSLAGSQARMRTIVGGDGRLTRDVFVVLQVAAALVLLAGAGLMVRTLANLRAINLGFRPDHLLTLRTTLSPTRYADANRRLGFYNRVVDGVRLLPSVESVAFGSTLPFTSIGNTRWFQIEAVTVDPDDPTDTLWRVGTPDYLRTLGVQLVEGRLFDDRDNADAPLAVVINQTMARKYLPHGAIGHRIRFGPSEPFYTIVGVVSDLRERGYELAMKPAVYVTTAQGRGGTTREYLIVRVAGDPIGVGNGVRAVVANVDPEQPLAAIQPMDEIVALDIADRGQQMRLLATFAGLAAFLAAVGLYGVLSYLVSQRRKEIGLRLALGATPSSVMRMVAARGAFLTAIGASLGLAVGWAGTQAMRSLLYGVSPSDPLTFAGVTFFFSSVAFVAMYVPARRATKVDPMVALRCE